MGSRHIYRWQTGFGKIREKLKKASYVLHKQETATKISANRDYVSNMTTTCMMELVHYHKRCGLQEFNEV